jgi:hypothetical protein
MMIASFARMGLYVVAASLLVAPRPALAATSNIMNVVAPPGAAAAEGNSNFIFPFTANTAGSGVSYRFQQVFASSAFSALPGPRTITTLRFRPDALVGASTTLVTISNFRADFSTTFKAPDALSAAFADNVGVDDTIAYNGPITIFSNDTGPAGGPKDFDVVLDLTTPFTYDPAAGNLLMDIRVNFADVSSYSSYLDAVNVTGDAVSCVYNTESATAATGNWISSNGTITQFSFIPEPSSLIVLLPMFLLLRRGAKTI